MSASPIRSRAGVAFILITIAAIALQRGATMPFASATVADARVVVSPIGLVRRLPDESVAECRWWPRLGDAGLCAVRPGGEAAMARVRRGYPASVIALWVGVLSLFLNVLRVPRRLPWAGPVSTAAASGAAAFATWSVAGAGDALAVLSGASLRFSEPGFTALAGAAVLTAVATGLLARPATPPA